MSDLRMPDLNKTIVAGRLTRDPELQYVASGNALCKMGLAVTRYYTPKDGERQEETTYVDVVTWGKTAEYVGEKLSVGRPVIIEGRLKSDSWEDKDTGKKRTKLEIVADRICQIDWDEKKDEQVERE